MKTKDVEKMLAAGLISPEQGVAIAAHFRLGESRGRNWLLISLCAVAALFILAGIIMLIAANWETIPALCKMGVAMGLLAAFWGGWVWQRERRPWLGEVLGFLGAGMWLGCISLYGQIFQLQNPFVEGCALFVCGILLFPFISRQRLLVGVVMVGTFILLGAMTDDKYSWLGMRSLLGPELWDDQCGLLTVQSLVFLGGIWWALAERWRVAGERWRGYGWMADLLLLAYVCVLQTCMYSVFSAMEKSPALLLYMVVAMPVLLLALHPRGTSWWCWTAVVLLGSSFVPLSIFCGRLDIELVSILIYFALAVLLMFCGFFSARIAWINTGTLMVVFAAVALVADVLGNYTASGVVLILGGLFLLGLGWLLEKGRRHLVKSVKNPTPSVPSV